MPALDAVEHYLRHRGLSSLRFAAGFEIDCLIKAALLGRGAIHIEERQIIPTFALALGNRRVWRRVSEQAYETLSWQSRLSGDRDQDSPLSGLKPAR